MSGEYRQPSSPNIELQTQFMISLIARRAPPKPNFTGNHLLSNSILESGQSRKLHKILTVSPSPSYYWDTTAPTFEQLRKADTFFLKAPPQLLYSSTKFRDVRISAMPEVAFLGRSNVGKSTLLNALMGREICHTSSKPGRTKSMNFFAVGGEDGHGNLGKMAVLDMPGYGKGSREEWGSEIMKYLIGRKQYAQYHESRKYSELRLINHRLRRAFLLIDSLHGLKSTDEELLSLFRQNSISHQIVLSKVDRVLFGKSPPSVARMERSVPQLDAIITELKASIQPGKRDGPEALGEIVTCTAKKSIQGMKLGISNIRWAVLAATGLSEQNKKILPSGA